jgi:hypothetical protein
MLRATKKCAKRSRRKYMVSLSWDTTMNNNINIKTNGRWNDVRQDSSLDSREESLSVRMREHSWITSISPVILVFRFVLILSAQVFFEFFNKIWRIGREWNKQKSLTVTTSRVLLRQFIGILFDTWSSSLHIELFCYELHKPVFFYLHQRVSSRNRLPNWRYGFDTTLSSSLFLFHIRILTSLTLSKVKTNVGSWMRVPD